MYMGYVNQRTIVVIITTSNVIGTLLNDAVPLYNLEVTFLKILEYFMGAGTTSHRWGGEREVHVY